LKIELQAVRQNTILHQLVKSVGWYILTKRFQIQSY